MNKEIVVLYSPSGNPGVYWLKDKQGLQAKGFLTEEERKAKEEAEALKKREEWLKSPESLEERFASLRAGRDSKLKETDYLMQTDYHLSDAKRRELETYRQALRDLPGLAGAPWDGGREKTPWPDKPDFL